MAVRLSTSEAQRLGLSASAKGKRGPRKPTAAPLWSAWGIPDPAPEFRFCERFWRFDWAWIEQKVALEVDGGLWTSGEHSRPRGQMSSMEKANRAILLGWRVLRCTPQQLASGQIMDTIKKALGL